jgi:hypothetical protein
MAWLGALSMLEQMFYLCHPVLPRPPLENPEKSMKQVAGLWRLTRMQTTIRPIALSAARSLLLVVVAMVLVLILLPAAIAAQAASI